MVAIPLHHVAWLPADKLEQLLDTYRVTAAFVPRGPAFSALTSAGFREVGSADGLSLLRRVRKP